MSTGVGKAISIGNREIQIDNREMGNTHKGDSVIEITDVSDEPVGMMINLNAFVEADDTP